MPASSTRREFLKHAAAAAAATALPGLLRAAEGPKALRPNIILMVSDELGYFEPGFMGNPNIRTPVLDKLAAEGVYFTQALAGSSGGPDAVLLDDGQALGASVGQRRRHPLRADEGRGLDAQKAGRHRGYGKWGCGRRLDGRAGKTASTSSSAITTRSTPTAISAPTSSATARRSRWRANDEHGQDVLAVRHHGPRPQVPACPERRPRRTAAFSATCRSPRPTASSIPDEDPAWAFTGQDWPEQASGHAVMVTMIDRSSGKVVEIPKEIGQDKNTIIFFSGDNGGATTSATRTTASRGQREPQTRSSSRHKGSSYGAGCGSRCSRGGRARCRAGG